MSITFSNKKSLSFDELQKIEDELYRKFLIHDTIKAQNCNLSDVFKRKTEKIIEQDYNVPQNIFLLSNYKGHVIVGRKIKSILNIEGKINAINCSMITASMILGFLKSRKKFGRSIEVVFFRLTQSEKIFIFDEIKKNRLIDIYYPYRYRNFVTNKEKICARTGWIYSKKRKKILSQGEEHYRRYTKKRFKHYIFVNKKIYDPACSTGEFLYKLKKSYPMCYTIGHDLSAEMVEHASKFLDETFCCNALNSPIKEATIDMMFVRFLNSEIVTSKMAYKIMKVLIKKVKNGGLIICFGHTRVLLRKEWFKKMSLSILECNGYDRQRNAIFQYYILEKK